MLNAKKTIDISVRLPEDVIMSQQAHEFLQGMFPLSTGYYAFAKGHTMTRRMNKEYIMIYCLAGKGWFERESKQWAIQPGEMLFCLPGAGHKYWADQAAPWTIYWAHFIGRQAPEFMRLLGIAAHTPILSLGHHPDLNDRFQDLFELMRGKYSLAHLNNAAGCLKQLLGGTLLHKRSEQAPKAGRFEIDKVIAFMLKHIARLLTLEEMAAHFYYSPSHFSRRFRDKTELAPIDYFIRLKMQRACELLDTSSLQVGEIGRLLGYDDQYYFSRIFKKVMHASPRNFREKSAG